MKKKSIITRKKAPPIMMAIMIGYFELKTARATKIMATLTIRTTMLEELPGLDADGLENTLNSKAITAPKMIMAIITLGSMRQQQRPSERRQAACASYHSYQCSLSHIAIKKFHEDFGS